MRDFNYFTPTQVVFGAGVADKAGELVHKWGGRKALIHYGGGSVVRSGLLERVKASLDSAGIAHVELGGVVPNPRMSKIYEGIELCKKEGVDFLLAVGGGSVIDSAKAIAYALAEPDKEVWELYEHLRSPKGCLPVGVVLTIAAAGSEMSNSSVITNDKTWEKRGCNSDLCRPRFALMDPALTVTLPDYQTQSGCVDIMMHTMERYFTGAGTLELTDALAEGLLRTVMVQAEILHENPKDLAARSEVMWASSLSHNGLTGCGSDGGDWSCHGLEHELGGMFDVTHGAGLAAIWGSWARYVYKDCLPRFVKYAKNVFGISEGSDGEIALKGIEATEEFYRRIHMPTNLRELGVTPTDEQIQQMAESCIRAGGGKKGSAKVLYVPDCVEIYKMAR